MNPFAIFKSKKGQSLVEAMVALGVLTIGFLGIVSLLSKSLFYSRNVSDTMKATYLASEGIEITKNLIDHDIADGSGWGACFAATKDFQLDYASTCDNLIPYIYPGQPLLFDSANGFYGYTSSASALKTNFVREIRVAENGDEITIKSIITWSTGPITTQSIVMEDHFYNWQSK